MKIFTCINWLVSQTCLPFLWKSKPNQTKPLGYLSYLLACLSILFTLCLWKSKPNQTMKLFTCINWLVSPTCLPFVSGRANQTMKIFICINWLVSPACLPLVSGKANQTKPNHKDIYLY